MQHDDARARMGPAPGLNWIQTFVLKAACDVALELRERRLTVDDVAERLAITTSISRPQILKALGPLSDHGYLYADDAPGNPTVMLELMPKGLDQYCRCLLPGYQSISRAVLTIACQDVGIDVVELAHRAGQRELLVEHILDDAWERGLLRLRKRGQYIVVEEISPQLRRWISGAA